MDNATYEEKYGEGVAIFLAQKALEEMANGLNPAAAKPSGKTDRLSGPGKLATTETSEKHVMALARKIMSDPSFPLMVETARTMAAKYPMDESEE